MRIPVLYQDEQLVAVDKPVGMPTHAPDPDDPYPGDALRTLQAQLGLPYLGMHQRLDADTSGVLLFATDPAANAPLAAAFAGGQVSKSYLALVHGAPRRSSGTIDAPIVRVGGGRYAIAAPGDPRGLAARTGYEVRAQSPERAYTLLEVRPAGGRTHQIRLHLRHAGMPVVGDVLYDPERQAPRLFLHAHCLELPHPIDGKLLTITAPVPPAFEEFAKSATALRAAALAATPNAGGGWFEALIDLALARRAPLHADPRTTFYRLINGTPDGFPDLTVDLYGDVLVASSYDEEGRAAAPGVLAPLMERSGATSLYVKQRPRQASQVSEEEVSERAPSQPLLGRPREELVAHEEGLAYTIRPGEGLSTGIFPDMRPTRARVRAWAGGKRVLNCFAYTCGFGLAATAGHAARVLNIDLSRGVLARGMENYRLNGFDPDQHDFVFGDVFDWLARLARRGEQFELVILDPPGFARTKSGRFSAGRDYGKLAALAAKVTPPGGHILACCNVAELTWRSYRTQLLAGINAAGRSGEVEGVYHEPAIDFPVAAGRDPYLKIALLRIG